MVVSRNASRFSLYTSLVYVVTFRSRHFSGRKVKELKSLFSHNKGNIFLKEINGFMLSVTDQCLISPAASKGAFLSSGTLDV